jgi:hypothetical protein
VIEKLNVRVKHKWKVRLQAANKDIKETWHVTPVFGRQRKLVIEFPPVRIQLCLLSRVQPNPRWKRACCSPSVTAKVSFASERKSGFRYAGDLDVVTHFSLFFARRPLECRAEGSQRSSYMSLSVTRRGPQPLKYGRILSKAEQWKQENIIS